MMKNYEADTNNIYIQNGSAPDFNYSDGNENEEYLLQTIQQASDISIGSAELFAAIKDWPSLYHLSPVRADLLRPLAEQLKGKEILEIGCGCGAITRFLGELGSPTTALEGSYRRAHITAARCKGLTNVQVVCDNFSAFNSSSKFDFITLIGVLEYSNLYMPGDEPVQEMLRKAKTLLKPGGSLIIAIENKLGLKYWAGAPEDHTGQAYFGIQNRYSHASAVTFGKKELQQLLANTGFEQQHFLYPFPDYKFADAIITETGMQHPAFDLSMLLLEKYEYVQADYYKSHFSTSLAAAELRKNGLLDAYANSFLVITGQQAIAQLPADLLAHKFSTQRQKPYCKQAVFALDKNEKVTVNKTRLYPPAEPGLKPVISVITDEPYSSGALLVYDIIKIVSKNNWSFAELLAWAGKYYEVLQANSYEKDGKRWLQGKYIDLTPFNIIISPAGRTSLFDLEWVCIQPLPLPYVFFRGIIYSLGSIAFFCEPDPTVPTDILDISTNLLKAFLPFTETMLEEWRRLEIDYFSGIGLGHYVPFTHTPLKLRQDGTDVFYKDLLVKYDKQHAAIVAALEENAEWKIKHESLGNSLRRIEILFEQRNTEMTALMTEKLSLENVLAEKDRRLQHQNRELSAATEKNQQQAHQLSDKENLQQQQDQKLALLYQQVDQLNNRLTEIYTSEGYRLLSIYYRFKGKWLPEGSPRYNRLKKLFNKIRNKKETSAVVTDFTGPASQMANQAARTHFDILEFPVFEQAKVSIIIPVHNGWEVTYACLESVLHNTFGIPYEVIVTDDASADETLQISNYIKHIVTIRNETSLGFLKNCNQAATHAKGDYIFFLNNDTVVKPFWLSSLAELMDKDAGIGMAGSKLIYPDGKLQEAGGIIWNDASGWNFGNRQDPAAPEFNYVKETDYISGAAIMVRATLWKETGGFDARYTPAYCEDSDLAFEIRRRGFKVVYQPLSEVIHYEGYSHGTDTGGENIKSYQRLNNEKFREKWNAVLLKEQFANAEHVFWARDRSRHKKTILVVDHYVPHFDKDAGSKTVFQYLKLFVALGFNVKFIGDNFYRHEPYTTVLQQMGIEVLYGPWYAENWKQWIKDNGTYFDYVLLNRPHITIKYIDFVRANTQAKILYYGHDLHFIREQKQYEIEKRPELLKSAEKWKETETYIFNCSDIVLAPSVEEKLIINTVTGKENASAILPYFFEHSSQPITDFSKRKHILFVGGFTHRPNLDAVLWFANDILPHVIKQVADIQFIIVGSNTPKEVQDLASPNIIIKGFLTDEQLDEAYAGTRLTVVPLRYGAGVKGKTVEAMQKAIPLLSTSIGVEGLPGDCSFLDIADGAATFAEKICSIYKDEEKLVLLSKKNAAYIQDNFSEKAAIAIVNDIFKLHP